MKHTLNKTALIVAVALLAFGVSLTAKDSRAMYNDEFGFSGDVPDLGQGGPDDTKKIDDDPYKKPPYVTPPNFPNPVLIEPVPDSNPPRSKPILKEPFQSTPKSWPTNNPPKDIEIIEPYKPGWTEDSNIPGQPPVIHPPKPEVRMPYKWVPSDDPNKPGKYVPNPKPKPATEKVPEQRKKKPGPNTRPGKKKTK